MPDFHYTSALRGDPPAAAQNRDLLDRRELALVAVERTRMPMVVTDPRQPDDPIVLANQAFLDLTGYTSDEVIGSNCRFLQGPDTNTSDVSKLADALRRGDDNIEVELLNYRKDGSTFVNALDIYAVRSEAGELLYYFASQKDLTAQRKAQKLESNERRLLMEVDHRALNALEIVQSIVSLSTAADVGGLSRAIHRRISSLARGHRLLAERSWQPVGLKELVKAQTFSNLGRQIAIEGDDTNLHPHIVQPLGLVIHELMSNALVHGRMGNNSGSVRLSWNVANDVLFLHWHEVTYAQGSARLEPAFGLQIVQTIVKEQLGGQPKVVIHDGVLNATITVPDAIAAV